MHAGPPVDSGLVAALEKSGMAWTVTRETLARRRDKPPLTAEGALAGRDIRHDEVVAAGPLGDIPIAVFSPPAPGPHRAMVVYLHGGGMFSGNRYGAGKVLDWVSELGVVIASIDYRLAPEYPDPAPADDCWAGLAWLVDHAGEWGVDPGRIIIAGPSAGGGLAAGVALRARDESGPALLAQLLICPMLDDRNETASSSQYLEDVPWTRGSNETAWGLLLGDPRPENVSPYAAPARATSLVGLPPAFIDVGTAEVFRDEDVDYASRLWADGVQAELHVWPGGYHGFDSIAPEHPLSVAARAARAAWLERVLSAAEEER